MISRLAGSIKTMLSVFFLTHTCAQREMETGYCRRAIHPKIFMRGIRNSHKVRQGVAKSDISAARHPPHDGLFITTFQQLTRDRTCSHSSIPTFVHPALNPAHSTHTPVLYFHAIQDGRRALSRCSRLQSSLTRETRNKQAIYIPRVAIVGYRCEFFPISLFLPLSLIFPIFPCLLIIRFSLPLLRYLFCHLTLRILAFDFNSLRDAYFIATSSQHQLPFI